MHTPKHLFFMIVAALLSMHQISNAQTPSWKWAKWSNGTQTTVRSICADASGNLYGTGSYASQTIFDTSTLTVMANGAFVVKYNTSGALIWAKNIKNSAFGTLDAKSIAIDGTGNLYLSGAYSGTMEIGSKTLTGGGHYVAKFDNSGTIQWVVNTQGSNAVAANGTGVFVAGGSIIQKFDATGTSAWTITGVKSNQGYTNIFSVAINSSGNLILAGDIDDNWTFGTKSITGGYQNIILMEVNTAGTVTWTKVLGTSTNGGDHAQHICLDAWDNIIMTGKVGGATTMNTVSLGTKNGYLVKLTPTGSAYWGTSLTNTATIYGEGGIFVASDPQGAMYVTGGFGNVDVTDGGTNVYIKGIKFGGNAYIFKFDSAGVFKSALSNYEHPTINNSRGMAIVANASGVYFGGTCAPNSEWGTLKVTGYGSVFAKIDGSSTSNGMNAKNKEIDFDLYPNPCKGNLYINLKSEVKNPVIINITSISGVSIYHSEMTGQINYIDLNSIAKGIYIARLITNEGIISKKIVVD